MLYTILIVLLVLALLGGIPGGFYAQPWGHYYGGGLGLVVLILVILLLVGRV
jgi:hypothetical protein